MSKGKGATSFPGAKTKGGVPAASQPKPPRAPSKAPRVAVRTRASTKGR